MSKTKKAILALILANTVWGAAVPIFKWSFQDISPYTLAFVRFALPTLILLPFIKYANKIRIRDGFYFILMGLFNFTFNIGLYFIGIEKTASINQPIIASAEPIFILFGSALFLKDAPSKKVLIGNCVGLTGILFIVLHPINHAAGSLFGNLLLILSTISAAMGTLVTKKLTKRYNTYTILFWSLVVATVSFFPVMLEQITTHAFFINLAPQSVIGILFGVFGSSLIGYSLFYYGIHAIKASEVTIFAYVDPITALLVAAPLLHEYPDSIFLLGTFFVFFGIYIAEGRLNWHPLHLLLR